MASADLSIPNALAPRPSANSRFPTDCLACPKHPPADLFDELKVRQKGTPAERDFQYWAGAVPPWRDGGGGAVTDSATLAPEEAFKLEVEEDDARNASTERLHARGVRVDWLLALTFALDLWEWRTSEVRGAPTAPLLLLLLLLPLFFFFSLFLSNTHSLSLSPFLLPALVSQVVKFLVKPATEFRGRCRFADLPFVQKFTWKATVFMSHCW
jgi:hypothetical protein